MQSELEPLFPPQEIAIAKAVKMQRCPIIGAMGSGKTRVAIQTYNEVMPSSVPEPTIVVCRTNAFGTWVRQLTQWRGTNPEAIKVVQGTKPQREKIWKRRGLYEFMICTPQTFVNDGRLIPKDLNLFMDEYHHWGRHRTKTWQAIKSHTLHSDFLFPLTGSPLWRGPQDFFPILNMCQRDLFPSYWRYVNTWCAVIEGSYGKEIVGPKNIENFREEIYAGYCAYMPKKETDKYLPKKNRIHEPIYPSKFQRKQIDKLEEDLFLELDSGQLDLVPLRITQIIRERQLLVCPKLIDPNWEWGAGIEAIGDKIEDLKTARPVVFTDFADAVPLLAEYLRSRFKKSHVYRLRGGMKHEDFEHSINGFNADDDGIMVCSLQYAESFEFPRSQYAFVLGFNWSPPPNEQAEDRLRRATSESSNITIYYMQYIGTIDGDMLQIVRNKYQNVRAVTPDDIIWSRQSRRKV